MNNYKKIYWLNGQGLDGVGSTKFILEFSKTYEEYKIVNYTCDNAKYANSSNFSIENQVNTENFIKEFEDVDIVYVNSFPSNKNTLEQVDNFYAQLWILRNQGKIIVSFFHFNTIAYFNKIPKILLGINVSDYIFLFNKKGTYGELIKKYLPHKYDRIREFSLPFELKDNPSTENREKSCIYTGRFATFKHPEKMMKLREYFNDLSFGYYGMGKTIEMKVHMIDNLGLKYHNKKDIVKEGDVEIRGIMKNKEIKERLSKSMFAFSGYRIKNPFDYGKKTEYAIMEMIEQNCIVILDEHHTDNIGISDYIHFKFNENNFEEIANEMKIVMNNDSLRNEIIKKQRKMIETIFCPKKVVEEINSYIMNQDSNTVTYRELKETLLGDKYREERNICFDVSDLKLKENRIYKYDGKKLRKELKGGGENG